MMVPCLGSVPVKDRRENPDASVEAVAAPERITIQGGFQTRISIF